MALMLHPHVQADYRVPYASPGGRHLYLSLYRPATPGPRPAPAVLLIHGGAWVAGTRFLKHWYAQELAARGYVAAAISYRKLPWHPFPACLHDAKAAVRWLRRASERLHLDPARIGVFGDSAGGHLALLLAATRPEDGLEGPDDDGAPTDTSVQATVSLYGVADLADYTAADSTVGRLPGTRSFFDALLSGFRESTDAAIAAASPTRYIHPAMGPVLLIHGDADPVVPVRQAERFHAKAREAGVDARLEVFPGRQHGFDYLRPAMRAQVAERFCGFFDEVLGAGDTPPPTELENDTWPSSTHGPTTTT